MIKNNLIKFFLYIPLVLCQSGAVGHAIGPLGGQPLAWSTDQISQVTAGGNSAYYPSETRTIEGKSCLIGTMLHVNVRDEFAFDIDEPVKLEIQFYLKPSESDIKIAVLYDKNDAIYDANSDEKHEAAKIFELPHYKKDKHWHTESVTLERARFANRGFSGTDLVIYVYQEDYAIKPVVINVCSIVLKRSYETKISEEYGRVQIDVADEYNKITPVRIGIYDKSERLPLPNDEAIPLRNYNDITRTISLRPGSGPWPNRNRSVFYINGSYEARLPVGDYQLVISKGPEYHVFQKDFTVAENRLVSVKAKLERWDNMAEKGWYSGDDHIHYARGSRYDDKNLLLFTQAEDLHVANILQMGNIGNLHFRQYNWVPISNDDASSFVLIPGQEDPRTILHGHSIQLNIKEEIRDTSRYLLYNEVFEKARAEGGLVGYAHFRDNFLNEGMGAKRGMALDVPFGLIDFAEVMQWGNINTNTWFSFLNLGYKLSPSAGSDYPYIDVPGSVRSYVYLDKEFTPEAWMTGLRRGNNFVTNGPMLEISVNNLGMGSELHLESGQDLFIEAKARMNPDIDMLDRLELIEQGDVIKSASSENGAPDISFKYRVRATHGTWFVLRAYGKKNGKNSTIAALSAPIYVYVDGRSFWKPSAVPAIVFDLKEDLKFMLSMSSDYESEPWDMSEMNKSGWESQKKLLRQRVEKAKEIYDKLVEKAEKFK